MALSSARASVEPPARRSMICAFESASTIVAPPPSRCAASLSITGVAAVTSRLVRFKLGLNGRSSAPEATPLSWLRRHDVTISERTAVPDFGRQIVRCKFCYRRRAGTRERERLGALL